MQHPDNDSKDDDAHREPPWEALTYQQRQERTGQGRLLPAMFRQWREGLPDGVDPSELPPDMVGIPDRMAPLGQRPAAYAVLNGLDGRPLPPRHRPAAYAGLNGLDGRPCRAVSEPEPEPTPAAGPVARVKPLLPYQQSTLDKIAALWNGPHADPPRQPTMVYVPRRWGKTTLANFLREAHGTLGKPWCDFDTMVEVDLYQSDPDRWLFRWTDLVGPFYDGYGNKVVSAWDLRKEPLAFLSGDHPQDSRMLVLVTCMDYNRAAMVTVDLWLGHHYPQARACYFTKHRRPPDRFDRCVRTSYAEWAGMAGQDSFFKRCQRQGVSLLGHGPRLWRHVVQADREEESLD